MKKLIVLVAFAVSAFCAQAAATNWALTAGQWYSASDSSKVFSGLFELYASGGDLSEATVVFSANPPASMYNKTAFSSEVLTAGQTYDFYIVLTEGDKQFTSTTKSISAVETGSATINFGSLKTATQTAGNWAAVPEPTSGLLMLLGMAGLALRRKRA